MTRIVANGRHRIIIGEHPDSAYIASGVDSASIGGFYTADQCDEIARELRRIARRIKERGRCRKVCG